MSIANALHKKFLKARKTLVLAESITGGQIGATLISQPGASQYFLGSFVVYSNALKVSCLGVKEKTLQSFGAVSEQAALEMVEGIFERTNADYALSVTGIAGPSGEGSNKPIGTVWCAVAARDKTPWIMKWQLSGSRLEIISEAVNCCLQSLLTYQEKNDL